MVENQNFNYREKLQLSIPARQMHRTGELPNTSEGVGEDPFVLQTLAATPPKELEADLATSTQALWDENVSRARRAYADYELRQADDEADELERSGSPELADIVRDSALEDRIQAEAEGIEHFNASHAQEKPSFTINEAVRIFNGREVLGARAVRFWRKLGLWAGAAAGVSASYVAGGDHSPRNIGLGVAGAVVGAAVPDRLRERIVARGAHREASKMLAAQDSHDG